MTKEQDAPPLFIEAINNDTTPHSETLKLGKTLLKQFLDQQFMDYEQGAPVSELIKARANFIDQLLKTIWTAYIPDKAATLIAVGGYGRGELHPYSDIDLLILCDDLDTHQETLSQFITLLWDLGFDVGSAVRTIQDCVTAGREDVTTATNLLESRWITGEYERFQRLQNVWDIEDFWPSKAFFEAKVAEQENRHKKFNDTVYQLEPNLKESPGGLRDIQTIYWVAKRHFNATSINELVQRNFLTTEEYIEIESAYKQLNRTRFALQHLKKRREDRLQFDNQQAIAESFHYVDNEEKMAVEQFMSSYYRNVQVVVKLNEILLQHFREVLFDREKPTRKTINSRFQLIDGYLDIKHPKIFEKNPTTLLEIFIVLETLPDAKGLRSNAIRSVRENLYLIDDDFRNDPINKALFMEIFRQPKGVNAAVKRMHSYGILGAYLPLFQKITGLMQFNIFHAYTVDDHTMLTIRNLRRFFIDEFIYEFPTAHEIAKNLCKPEILFLSGLFHDIAKGRGGSHEVLGAIDALEFAKQHNLSLKDEALLSWLVRRHLDFSSVAQRKDLSDPDVINYFANLMGDQQHLDYLYLLTVADVCATSNEVWNDWKNSLFLQLYNETSKALDLTNNVPKSKTKKALETQEKAKEMLAKRGLSSTVYNPFWKSFAKSEFFSRQNASDVAKITKQFSQVDLAKIHLSLQAKTKHGASELIMYMPDRDYLFAHIMHTLDRLNINVVEARVYSSTKNMTLVIIYFLNKDTQSYIDSDQHDEIMDKIREQLEQPDIDQLLTRSTSQTRRTRCFDTPTEITFTKCNDEQTELSIHTKDIPGLLSKIGYVLKTCNIRLHDAKIHTVGEKAEDVFLISDTQNRAIASQQKKQEFIERLLEQLE